ncbi:DUF3267 domain-containing protein [Candidatus Viridilinea mediisalina]|nr:DUF3267 domain-containing protein [Candidatus Viridilinea mediisalina]
MNNGQPPPTRLFTATKTLPPNYLPAGAINLATNKALQLGLSLGSVILFVLFGLGFMGLIARLRPDLGSISVTFGLIEMLFVLLMLVLTTFIVVWLHEAIHGFCFWLFTRSRPHYGFKGLYAYAAAPDWYLSRLPYAITGAAPLILMTLLGLLIATVAPALAMPLLIYALSLNAAGAIGDMFVVAWIAVSPKGALFRDHGDALERFRPGA